MIIQPALCGNCHFSSAVKENLKLVQCHGAPPSVFGIPTPQGIQTVAAWPQMDRAHPACALHKRAQAQAVLAS